MLVINEELLAIEDVIDDLVDAIRQTSQFQAYALAKKAFDEDALLKSKVTHFQELKQVYEVSEKTLAYHPEGKK
ncbi:YlbF family regulator [Streptococcus ictaluri]|uniref:Uncharacterized protein n=1 Tax=Streptococcus ictaluri 707-05 TaxID=764299 RepID=G5K1I3_9STRE|nr:YlbF family regulator [Streptococcus ictaluri]EHI70072.1 hypothetical protein STRIC_2241 [Streptococcus ictaluri 707-05]